MRLSFSLYLGILNESCWLEMCVALICSYCYYELLLAKLHLLLPLITSQCTVCKSGGPVP